MSRLLAIALAAAFMSAGCTNGAFTPTAKSAAEQRAKDQRRGEARKAAFVECMELAAKMPRQSDDDVAEIVEACGSQSYYLTNYQQ